MASSSTPSAGLFTREATPSNVDVSNVDDHHHHQRFHTPLSSATPSVLAALTGGSSSNKGTASRGASRWVRERESREGERERKKKKGNHRFFHFFVLPPSFFLPHPSPPSSSLPRFHLSSPLSLSLLLTVRRRERRGERKLQQQQQKLDALLLSLQVVQPSLLPLLFQSRPREGARGPPLLGVPRLLSTLARSPR